MAEIDVKSSSSNSVDLVGLDNIKADLTLNDRSHSRPTRPTLTTSSH